jgi:hypothetical protein
MHKDTAETWSTQRNAESAGEDAETNRDTRSIRKGAGRRDSRSDTRRAVGESKTRIAGEDWLVENLGGVADDFGEDVGYVWGVAVPVVGVGAEADAHFGAGAG